MNCARSYCNYKTYAAVASHGSGSFSKAPSPRCSPWTIPVGKCAIVGRLSRVVSRERIPMPTISQRIASAFAVLCGPYGDVTKMAQEREPSRQALYREAEHVVNAVEGSAVQRGIEEL